MNIEQPISDNAGLFVRAGWDQGQFEPYEYTDIDGKQPKPLTLETVQ